MQTTGDSVSSILYNLLEKLGENLSTGDLNKVTEFLKTSEARVTELLSKEPSEKVREALKKVQADVSQLVQKLSSGEASLDDVRVFLNNEKEKFKNRLTDRIKDLSKEKKME